MSRAKHSPITGQVRVVERQAERGVTEFCVDPAEEVFIGHYPGFPIFPGVCLVEVAHRSTLEVVAAPLKLRSVDSTRFLGPVLPGDEVWTEIRWSRESSGMRCRGELSTARGKAADVRMSYELEEDR